ncbi:nitrilase family protein [Pseudomonas putida]|uniref:nitrilase family protein n=1 Tax=Pseudomonas putida TaxID=303 RepID=UPI0018A997F9|nr:nitrilase family protein [Pseudomonas putida]MBF8658766.1 nitrilase family protein [Pseudomonas putida]
MAAFSPARIAVIQFAPQVGLEHCAGNLAKSVALARSAARAGANLIVLPELTNTGHTFVSRAEAFAHAETLEHGPSVQAWADLAEQYQVYLAAGFVEQDGLKLYDSAVLFGPSGLLGHYRKAHLGAQENLWCAPGNLGFPVFDTSIGRIGLLIGGDIWFPEVPRLLAAQGADLICSLNNWVWTPPPLFDQADRCMANYLTMTAAHVNNIFIAAANRIGDERGRRFLGCSLIAGTNGWPIGEVAGAQEQTIVYADIDLSSARSASCDTLNDAPRDRRTDLYDVTLGYRLHAAMPLRK